MGAAPRCAFFFGQYCRTHFKLWRICIDDAISPHAERRTPVAKGILVSVALAIALFSRAAAAELTMSLGVEYLNWEEDTSPSVTEEGPLIAGGIIFGQNKPEGLVFSYRGKLYFGGVEYNGAGLFTGTPISSTTYYTGIVNEGQARWRKPIKGNYHADLVFGLGWDLWTRELSYFQKEDFSIVYLRLGSEVAVNNTKGWTVGAGLKYPVFTREDAHLTDIGFDRNPTLEPGGDLSGYAQIGYWFDDKLGLIGYFESYRFKKSNEEMVNSSFGPGVVFQPASTMSMLGLKLEYRIK